MTERSLKCPACEFQFARLVDAGDFHAYVCPGCGWEKPTNDRRSGNRPSDVCALCDTAIWPRAYPNDYHLYIGSGWIHGGGREYIPVHASCVHVGSYPEGCPGWENAAARVRDRVVVS